MTRFIWDKFSKDYLETFLSPYGEVKTSFDVTAETQEIDLWFIPHTSEIPSQLGLLGRLSQNTCLFEPYRNPVTLNEIMDCLSKLSTVRQQLQREVKNQKQRLTEENIPRLWILTPTASQRIINSFSGQLQDNWEEGIYFLAEAFRTAIIVIHQLPETQETLWLRLLGREGTRNRAIDELESLTANNPLKSATLKLLYNLSRNLEALPKKTQEERKFIMRLTPLYEQEQEQMFKKGQQQGEVIGLQKGEVIGLQKGEVIGLQKGEVIGLQKGEAKLVLRLLNRRLGEIPQNLTETIQNLSVEQLENLGDALLDFDNQTDLVQWLNRL